MLLSMGNLCPSPSHSRSVSIVYIFNLFVFMYECFSVTQALPGEFPHLDGKVVPGYE